MFLIVLCVALLVSASNTISVDYDGLHIIDSPYEVRAQFGQTLASYDSNLYTLALIDDDSESYVSLMTFTADPTTKLWTQTASVPVPSVSFGDLTASPILTACSADTLVLGLPSTISTDRVYIIDVATGTTKSISSPIDEYPDLYMFGDIISCDAASNTVAVFGKPDSRTEYVFAYSLDTQEYLQEFKNADSVDISNGYLATVSYDHGTALYQQQGEQPWTQLWANGDDLGQSVTITSKGVVIGNPSYEDGDAYNAGRIGFIDFAGSDAQWVTQPGGSKDWSSFGMNLDGRGDDVIVIVQEDSTYGPPQSTVYSFNGDLSITSKTQHSFLGVVEAFTYSSIGAVMGVGVRGGGYSGGECRILSEGGSGSIDIDIPSDIPSSMSACSQLQTVISTTPTLPLEVAWKQTYTPLPSDGRLIIDIPSRSHSTLKISADGQLLQELSMHVTDSVSLVTVSLDTDLNATVVIQDQCEKQALNRDPTVKVTVSGEGRFVTQTAESTTDEGVYFTSFDLPAGIYTATATVDGDSVTDTATVDTTTPFAPASITISTVQSQMAAASGEGWTAWMSESESYFAFTPSVTKARCAGGQCTESYTIQMPSSIGLYEDIPYQGRFVVGASGIAVVCQLDVPQSNSVNLGVLFYHEATQRWITWSPEVLPIYAYFAIYSPTLSISGDVLLFAQADLIHVLDITDSGISYRQTLVPPQWGHNDKYDDSPVAFDGETLVLGTLGTQVGDVAYPVSVWSCDGNGDFTFETRMPINSDNANYCGKTIALSSWGVVVGHGSGFYYSSLVTDQPNWETVFFYPDQGSTFLALGDDTLYTWYKYKWTFSGSHVPGFDMYALDGGESIGIPEHWLHEEIHSAGVGEDYVIIASESGIYIFWI